jgi:hypothetical protein
MTTTYLRFDPQLRNEMMQRGLSFDWLTSLFLNNTSDEHVPRFLDGMTSSQRQFATRQTLASGTTYASLRKRHFECPDPWLATATCAATVCLTLDARERLPFEMLPLYYKFKSHSGEEFWICVYHTYGQVTQVFFPNRRLVVYDIFQSNAESVIGSLEAFLSRHQVEIVGLEFTGIKQHTKFVGLLDMVTNFGHQAINHLSGIQRLVDLSLLEFIDELWVSGALFFGDIDTLFPELEGRVRYFTNRWTIASELLNTPIQLVRIGSTYLSSNLRRRILQHARRSENEDPIRSNLLVITVRAKGRMCANLPEVVGAIYTGLSNSCAVKIALDGWVSPESSLIAASSVGAAISDQYVAAIREEMALAQAIERHLPPRTIIVNTIGRSMLESLNDLSAATAYFSHIGTLQHKLGMLLGIPGVVHGPKTQLLNRESGPYLSEYGIGPTFMPETDVEDIPTVTTRGESFSDYRINDVTATIKMLRSLMRATTIHSDY